MEFVIVKWLHVLSSTLLFGTGIGSAFYLLLASLGRDSRVVAAVSRYVVWADWLFTAIPAVAQPVTGFWMAALVDYPLARGWLAWSIALYVVALGCWLPVVALQMRLRDLAGAAAARCAPLPAAYWRALRLWVALGVPAFAAFVGIFYLMVARPV